MLEGKEIEGKIGEKGSYYVDVSPDLVVDIGLGGGDLVVDGFKAVISVQLTIWQLLEKAALATGTKWDDEAVAVIEKIFGVKK